MASLASGLCKTATINELREWEKVPLDHAFLQALDRLLLEIYETLRPKPIHYGQRNILVDVFNKMVTKIFGKGGGFPVVEEFGSFKMDLFTADSDLDLSVNFSDSTLSTSVEYSRAEKIKALRKLSKILYAHQRQGHVTGVSPIMSARVPVLKATDCGTGVECDISIENKDGISRSAIIFVVSSIDERFRILCYLIKMWAKANDINSSKDHTLSSMAIIALVAFHLQTRNTPIIPPFSALLRGGRSISKVKKSVLQFENFGRGNKESIAELFISLICKLTAVENLWNEGLCASMFEGTWVYKRGENSSKAAGMNVEDFLDRSDNFARSVGKDAEMEVIKECTQKALNYLTRFLSGDVDSYKLKTCLFGPVFSTLSPIANKRLAWEDVPIPPIERDAVPGRSKLDKKRKHEHVSSKASNAKRSRYDVPQAQQEQTPVYTDRYHQGPTGGFHFTGYDQRLLRIPYPIPNPYLSRASAHLLEPRSGYGQNPINPSGPGFVMTPRQFSHGPGILPTTNFSHRYHQPDSVYRCHQPDPVYRYGRGFRE